jgi:hypothetical protein
MTITLTEQDGLFFEKAITNRFIDEVQTALQHDMPGRSKTTDLRDTIEYGIKRAEKYGITDRACVKDYIYLMHTRMGTRFDETPAARNILNDRSLDESGKIGKLKEYAKRLA